MKKIFLRKSVEIAIALMLIICALLPFAFPVAGAGNTTMGCYPSSYDVTVGETFNVTVWLNADENVDSWLVDMLNFNETVLGMINATAVSISSFWKSSGFYDNGTIDNDSGKITGIQAFIYSGSTANTTLFTVDFVALKPGLCYINLTDAEAFSGGPNVLHTWYNTSVTVYQEGSVLSGENPSNGATSVEITQSTVNVTITDAEGDPIDWTIQGQYVTNTGANGASNGSVSANLITPLPYGTTVTWYVNVTDGYDWTNETYHFTTRSRPSDEGEGDTTPPTAPTNVRCTTPESDSTPSFSWNASTNASEISCYYVKIDDGTDTWVGNVLTWTSTSAIEDGTHTFYVKAKDASSNGNIGSYSSCSFTIDTTAVGTPPVADANGPYTGLTFQNITFDGTGSYDTDGTITNYTWDFGDNITGYGVKPTHSYNMSGIFNITLTVTDNDGPADTNTTTANITLDSDGDGWSDETEESYETNISDPESQPLDTDNDGIPDNDSPDGNYTGDPDDDNDGLDDYIEEMLGSDSKNKSDVTSIEIEGTTHYLVDIDGDGYSDKFHNSISEINTTTEITDDGKYLIDIDGDGIINWVYDPSSGTTTPYEPEEKSSLEIPIIFIAPIIAAIIIILIIAALFKAGYLYKRKKYYYRRKK